jgi:hypothetical protein
LLIGSSARVDLFPKHLEFKNGDGDWWGKVGKMISCRDSRQGGRVGNWRQTELTSAMDYSTDLCRKWKGKGMRGRKSRKSGEWTGFKYINLGKYPKAS